MGLLRKKSSSLREGQTETGVKCTYPGCTSTDYGEAFTNQRKDSDGNPYRAQVQKCAKGHIKEIKRL